MYIPQHFAQPSVAVLQQLIRARPLATLVNSTTAGLSANPIPFYLSPDPSPLGTLRGHISRANPLWQESGEDAQALAIFHGPQAYISPSWYPSKAEHGKAVPTWNYVVAHAHGQLRFIEDPVWLRAQLDAITQQQEADLAHPWQVADAPPAYIEKMIGAVVGVELVLQRLSGKWKMSQNQPEHNQRGVVAGLRATGRYADAEVADIIAAAVQESG